MSIELQPHIHLDTTLTGAPEYSPETKWKIRVDGWIYQPEVIMEHRRTLTGKLKKHVLKTSGGSVINFQNYGYVVRVDDYFGMTAQERLDKLVSMQGKQVYLIDILHSVDDGQNHGSFVKTMFMESIQDVSNINPQLTPLYVGIQLVDDYTVT